jgi:mannosyltransferase
MISTAQPQVSRLTNRTAALSPARAMLLLGVTTAVGAVLRWHLLAARSLWIDEAASVTFATLPGKAFLKVLWGYQGNMALYYTFLHGWIHLGDSEFAVRSLSVLFGVLTIPAIYLLGARLFDRATGLTAAALLSVHSFHIHWSQETRAYSLLILLLVVTCYLLIVALESTQKMRYWMAFSVLAALCVYAHVFAILVLAAFALAIAFPKPFRIESPTIIASAAVFAFLCEPMAAFVVVQHADQLDWIPRPSLSGFYEFLKLLTGQGGVVLVVVYLVLGGLAFLHPAGVQRLEKEKWALRLLVLWLLLLPTVTLAVTPIKPLFYPRYMVICVPALVLLAARGITKLYRLPEANRWAGATAFLLVVTLSLWGTHEYFVNLGTETSDWRSAVSYILQHQQPGDGAVFFLPNAYCYRYYVHRAQSQHEVTTAPDVLYPPAISRSQLADDLRQLTSGRQRVWFVLHIEVIDPQAAAIIRSTLAEKFQLVDEHKFPGEDLITVALYNRSPYEP